MTGAPIFEVRTGKDGRVASFLCPHCRRPHLHGTADLQDGQPRHRVAHCHDPASPYQGRGYLIRLAQR